MSSKESKQIVIYHSDYCGVTGDIVIPTDFAITIFPNRVEILWGVAWCRGGAGGTEILDANYFQTHTIEDFETFLRKKASDKFVGWFNIRNNPTILELFHS